MFADILKKILRLKIGYIFVNCGNTLHKDINVANNILKHKLESFGVRN